MSLSICGLATALPQRSIEQSAAATIAQTFLAGHRDGTSLPALFRRTQVRTRSSVLLENRRPWTATVVLLAGRGWKITARRPPCACDVMRKSRCRWPPRPASRR